MKRQRKTLLYGGPGIGKSTFGSQAPKPIAVQTEDGMQHLDVPTFGVARTTDEVISWISALAQDDHDYQTVVVDSADWLERLLQDEVCKAANVSALSDIDWGKGPDRLVEKWRFVLDGLDYLNREKNMGIIVIAHSQVERFNDPESEPYDRYSPRFHKKTGAIVQEWADEIFFANFQTVVVTKDEGFGRERSRATGTGARQLQAIETPAAVAKNRLGMPQHIPFSYAEYYNYLNSK